MGLQIIRSRIHKEVCRFNSMKIFHVLMEHNSHVDSLANVASCLLRRSSKDEKRVIL
jgi:hypothetical protein